MKHSTIPNVSEEALYNWELNKNKNNLFVEVVNNSNAFRLKLQAESISHRNYSYWLALICKSCKCGREIELTENIRFFILVHR